MDDEHLPDCCHCASYSFGSRHKLNLVWPGSSDFYCKLIQLTTSISNICFNSDLARHQRVKKPLSLLLALHKCRQENGRYFFLGCTKLRAAHSARAEGAPPAQVLLTAFFATTQTCKAMQCHFFWRGVLELVLVRARDQTRTVLVQAILVKEAVCYASEQCGAMRAPERASAMRAQGVEGG